MSKKINVGDLVKDSITGFQGIVVAETRWLNGCIRLTVQPKSLKNGKPIETETIDINQIELVKSMGHSPYRETGGPRPAPKDLPSPKR